MKSIGIRCSFRGHEMGLAAWPKPRCVNGTDVLSLISDFFTPKIGWTMKNGLVNPNLFTSRGRFLASEMCQP